MTDHISPGALTAPSTAQRRNPILSVLKPRLPSCGLVLEIAAGAGEHADLQRRRPARAAMATNRPFA